MLDEIKKDLEWGRKVCGRPQESLDMEQVEWLIQQVEEFERHKKYVMYFCGKDKVNDIRLAMQDKELD